ncbi:hypothetical protein OK015_05750 [Mycobacterium sp. Aquia_216]|uniref:DUF7937 domain-containing protein n=1 Tax=Mycobacterium sp. Aquia_216 TaxID=2991729 RepID=UPI00227ACFEA|nr:hypothetical protein [Mycobacterium sp. Aquia_216]WAJ47558.1 hypothetical protein OK015_05750 [Mycobacterium sp. Aquia_216]
MPPQQTAPGPPADATPARRRNVVADLSAAVLLLLAPLLPWNLYFGIAIPDSNPTVFAVLIAVTLLSLIALALPSSGHTARGLRLALNVPYLLLVLAFVGFDVFETVRFGGTVTVPGGVGPGAWLGVAGALLSAQSAGSAAADDDASNGRQRSAQAIGYVSMVAAALSFGFTLYWRVKYALGDSADFGKQNIAVIATATVYGLVALLAVLVASRWLLRGTRASRLATIALGASTLVAGIVVWFLPVGRDIDAFHGIAQNTSTAGVGFEGYLAWAAAGAIFLPRTLFGRAGTVSSEEGAWRGATRTGLLLIAVWCLGSTAMRITDLAVAVSLDYPYSRYDSVVLAMFDAATAGLAIWLRITLRNDSASARLITTVSGLVATLSISRVIVGVVLAPRFLEAPNAAQNPVYGNDLAQQITSIFDVALSALALCILAAAIVTGHFSARRRRRRAARRHAVAQNAAAPTTRIPTGAAPPSAAATTRIQTGDSPTTAIPQLTGSPRIFRGDDSATRQIPISKPKIYRPPHDPS